VKEWETNGFYDFAGFRLDAQERRLWRGDELVSLTPKEFELLLMLVERAPRIVEKDELLERIWKDTFVEDGTLTRNVSWLRKKLENSADEKGAKFIQTIPKRGYRFLPSVTEIKKTPALIVEEQTVQHIRIEETLSFPDAPELPPTQADETAIASRRVSEIAKRSFENSDFASGHARITVALPAASQTEKSRFWLWAGLAFGATTAALIALFVYQYFVPRSVAPQIVLASKITPFSGLPGREETPAFSPDGKQIAFSWNGGDTQNSDVYIKLVSAGEPVRLTKHEADDLLPAFSPDGSHIAFVRSFTAGSSEVILIPALGGTERKICSLNSSRSSVSFSPDGRFLAVSDKDESGGKSGIFLVNIENGEKKRLTAPPDLVSDVMPRFSPDGETIAFVRSLGSIVQELFVAPASGEGEPRQLTFDKTWIDGAAWSSDGKRIVFASLRKNNSQVSLWQIPVTGGEPELIAAGGKKLGSPAVSPDGRTIAFVENSQDANIWRIEPDRLPARAAVSKHIESSRSENSPQFSSDGKRIVFASSRTANYEVWIADADGSNTRQLTDLQKFPAGSPRFSPDDRFVVFDAQIAGNGDIFVIPSEGGTMRRLTDAESFDFMPSWSRDGKWIYFASDRGGKAQIWKMPAEGGDAIQITRQGGRESYESPDGKELYYSKGEGIAGLWRVPVNGGEESPIAELSEAGYWRYWTVTPKGVYFVARSTSAPYQIKFYDFQNRETKEIAATEKPPIWVFPGLSVSPDGKTILYAQHDLNASSIMLAEFAETIR
jgi:Tol biopolymer transport system component/DNA-binding winged helix-turn-helix (wHTH) protein